MAEDHVPPTLTLLPPTDATLAHLKDCPWALKLIADPSLQTYANQSRIGQSTTTADSFVNRTLATNETIIAWQSLKSAPSSTSSHGGLMNILKLGSGVNGHIDTCHGGFVSLLLDEVLGSATDSAKPKDKSTMTAWLKVDYKRPISTPTVVLCKAKVDRLEGRKMFVSGSIEDGEGEVYAIGTGLFITVPKVLGRTKL